MDERKSGADKAFVQAIYFFSLIKEFRKAADLIEEKDNGSPLFALAKAWYRLWNLEEQDKAKLESDIDALYQEKDKVCPKIQLFMVRATIKTINKKFEECLDTLNEGIVFYPAFIPLMIEKYTCHMALGDWEEYYQTALEVSQREKSNISAAKALAFYELAREGNADNAFMKISELESLIDRREAKNPKLLYEAAHLFLRVCGRNKKIIEILQRIINKCRKTDSLNADYVIELGNQCIMLGEVSEAYKLFQEANSLDESKLESITGMI